MRLRFISSTINGFSMLWFRDKKNRRDKKGQSNAQSTQNGCTSPSHDSNEADVMPVIDTPSAHSVRYLFLLFNIFCLVPKLFFAKNEGC